MMASAFAIAVGAVAVFAAGGGKMKIRSSAFQEGGSIPSKFTCDGSDASPALRIEQIPGEAKSLALIAEKGPDGFYRGPIAESVAASTRLRAGHSIVIIVRHVARVVLNEIVRRIESRPRDDVPRRVKKIRALILRHI